MTTTRVVVEAGAYSRTVWFSPGPVEKEHSLCVFLDGDHYLQSVRAGSLLAEAIARNQLPPMSFAFVAHASPAARHEDYTCNERFGRYVAEELVGWARSQLGSIAPTGNLVCGLSLSGLASAYIAMAFPRAFGAALCQSGSFWWEDGRFTRLVREHAPVTSRCWLSVGDQETEQGVSHPPTGMYQGMTQVAGVQAAVDALRAGGAEVRYNLYSGGHVFGPWADELCAALAWLAGESPAGDA